MCFSRMDGATRRIYRIHRQLSNSAFPSKVLVVLLSILQSIQREAFRTNELVTSNVEYPSNPPDNPVSVVGSSTEDTFTAIDVS